MSAGMINAEGQYGGGERDERPRDTNDLEQREGACEGRRVSLARIEGDEQSGCRGSAISVGRVFRQPSGPPGASLNASPLRPRVGGTGTRQKTPLSDLQRLGGCTLGGMNFLDPSI